MRAAFSPVELRVGRCGPYQAELGLQLDLEGLEGPLQLVDLRPGGLKALCARRHLLVQLVELEDTERLTVTDVGPTFTRGESNVKFKRYITFPLYQLSISRRFLSVMASY